MTALIIARIAVKDPEKMKAYGAAAGPTIAKHEGTFVQRGKHIKSLLGEDASQAVAIIEFPSISSAQDWFNSRAYQALKDLREEAAEMQFTLFETT